MSKQQYLIFGAGAIGATVAAWLAEPQLENEIEVSVFDRQDTIDTINKNGIEVYLGEEPTKRYLSRVKAYSNLDDVPKPDVIIICVKNYSLGGVSSILVEKFGDTTPVIGLQNGVENQQILPKFFKKVIYGVVCYNAWVDESAVIGYQKKGPIALGHHGGVTEQEIQSIANTMNKAVDTQVYPKLNDAAHSKIIINLTNSLTTLVALHENDLS